MDSKNKKIMVTTIIGIATLVLLVVGATFAYFSVPIQNNYSKTKITSKIDSIGNVTLMPGSELAMEITGVQMMNMGQDVPYYGSSEGTTSIETSEVIGTASVTGNGVFTCTYDLTMDATGTNNMYEAVQSMSNNSGQLVLTVNGVRYDFSTSNLFPKTISGEMTGLTEGVSQDITAQLKLLNSGSAVQNELIGTDIEITFELDNFNCTVTEMGTSGAYVMKTSPANISEDLVEGLYRYQGTAEEVTNNYACFGTTDKNDCIEGDIIFQRIIGVTPNGELKMIYNDSLESVAWHNEYTLNISWPDSSLFKTLNSLETNGIMVEKEWKYGEFTSENVEKLNELEEALEIANYAVEVEKTFKNSISSKYGLITLTDITGNYNMESLEGGWLYQSDEWTSTKVGYYYGTSIIFYVHPESGFDIATADYKLPIRPVWYLNSNLTLTGIGTIDDPYMISN